MRQRGRTGGKAKKAQRCVAVANPYLSPPVTISASGTSLGGTSTISGPTSFTDPSILAAFTGVGTFGALVTYNAICGVDRFPACGTGASGNFDITYTAAETPLPAALPLFATGLGALGLLGWRRMRKRVEDE